GFGALDHAEHVQALSTLRGDAAVATTIDGSRVFLTTRDGLLVHDLADGVTAHVDASRYRLGASAFSADGLTLATLHTPRRGLRGSAAADEPRASSLLSRWNLEQGRLDWSIPLTFEPYAFSLDPGATSVVAAERLGTHHELHVFAARDGSYTTRTDLPG